MPLPLVHQFGFVVDTLAGFFQLRLLVQQTAPRQGEVAERDRLFVPRLSPQNTQLSGS